MTAETVITEIETLPASGRAKVFASGNHVIAADDSWIPGSFRQAILDADAGRLADMETVLSGRPPHTCWNERRDIP